MALGDYVYAVTERLAAICAADATWAALVPAGNRIKFTGNNPFPRKTNLMPRDFPQWEIKARAFTSSTSGQLDKGGKTPTFGNTGPAAPPICDLLVTERYTFSVVVHLASQKQNDATALETAFKRILIAAGPKLALSNAPLTYVQNWDWPSGRYDDVSLPGYPAPACRLTVELPVTLQFRASDLLA